MTTIHELKKDPVCVKCDQLIEGDVMAPEKEGPMHPTCWLEWLDERDSEN